MDIGGVLLLTEEEIEVIRNEWGSNPDSEDFLIMIVKAQLKKVVGRLEEISKARRTTSKHRVNYITISRKQWQSLLKEVE